MREDLSQVHSSYRGGGWTVYRRFGGLPSRAGSTWANHVMADDGCHAVC